MPAKDPRLQIGAEVHTKASYVTNFAECTRLFGSLASAKVVPGRVLAVVPGIQKDGRRKTDLRVRWTVQTKTVDKTLSLGSVKAGPPPAPTPSPPVAGTPSSQVSQAGDLRARLVSSSAPIGLSSALPPRPAAVASTPATLTPARSVDPATTTAHGLSWTAGPVSEPVGGPVARRVWSVCTMPGEFIVEEGDAVGLGQARTAYDYFLCMFTMDQLMHMVRLTSPKLEARGLPPTTAGEVLKFMGVVILATRYEFGARAELWATKTRNPYLVAPAFGERTGVTRCRFDALWSCLTFSEQRRGGGDDSEQSRWELISDFVGSINDHRDAHVSPSEYIYVDESMCKWYGQGGAWIQRRLPMYVALDCKPESGCEVQNAACRRSGIMLRLSVVTSAEYQQAMDDTHDDALPHGTHVLKRLVAPWAGTQRVVCADSYFASVTAATQLRGMGLRFIGVVKTATRGYPMQALSTLEVTARGDHATYFHTTAEGVVDLMAVMWVDRNRRIFIASASTSLPGEPYARI